MTVAGQRLVQIRQGRMAMTTWGDGDPVVLLHPLALCGELWRPLGTTLADEYTVYAPDLRGHGGTSWDRDEFTIDDMAADLAEALDTLTTGPVHLLGMSMGGGVAMTYAARHPDRVRSLILADTTAWYGQDAPTAWAERAEKAATVPRDKQVGFQVDRWFSDTFRDTHPDDVNRVVDLFVATDSAAHAAACRAMGAMDARDLLPAITAPTLVLVGEHDYATPPDMARYLADHITGATLRVLPDLRHMALIEQPGLAGAVAEFCR
ncbi:MAG TPA: alpha/beta fold hydrolase [Pseudonocardiaceae bacterium]|nr:alpha/beta fold hydrolase [Pseudonocardiaceae bacterium]